MPREGAATTLATLNFPSSVYEIPFVLLLKFIHFPCQQVLPLKENMVKSSNKLNSFPESQTHLSLPEIKVYLLCPS